MNVIVNCNQYILESQWPKKEKWEWVSEYYCVSVWAKHRKGKHARKRERESENSRSIISYAYVHK